MLLEQVQSPKKESSPTSIKNHSNLTVNVSRPYEIKQIDSRWLELKFEKMFTPRSYFASTIQAGNIYIHGGFNSEEGILGGLYTACLYDLPSTWKKVECKKNNIQNAPPALRNHTLCSYLSNLILVGGQRNVIENNSTIYKLDLLTNQWTKCKSVNIQNKKNIQFNLDSHTTFIHKNYLYVVFGYDSKTTEYMDGIWKICLDKINQNLLECQYIAFNQKEQNKITGRANVGTALVENQLFIFGGGNLDEIFDDFWVLNVDTLELKAISKLTHKYWPDRRKGHSMVYYKNSNSIFMFGGIKKLTKEQNDITVYMINRNRWIKIHSSTNEVYDSSPTLKEMPQSSPTIIDQKRRRAARQNNTFKLGLKSVSIGNSADGGIKLHQTTTQNFSKKYQNFHHHTVHADTTIQFKKRMSVVQEKKYRQFLARKKKLLSNISKTQVLEQSHSKQHKKKSHSPTSEALIFSLSCMGQQSKEQKVEFELPKVIYDKEKGWVIGKKPCARDGHAGLVHEDGLVIIGGDRHKVMFNDCYLFKMNKGVESILFYQTLEDRREKEKEREKERDKL